MEKENLQKINYQKILDAEIESIKTSKQVPKLLLHSCCAPCSSYVLEYLSHFFAITVFYYNPNIFPETEYEKRVVEQQKLIQEMETKYPLSFLAGAYNKEKFYAMAKGMEEVVEGGIRCFGCYELRLKETARIAHSQGFEYFTTTLSISPLKNAEKLNQIGRELELEYGVKYLQSDFKKKNGYKRSTELSKEYDLYRQDYCGCEFSYLAREKQKNKS